MFHHQFMLQNQLILVSPRFFINPVDPPFINQPSSNHPFSSNLTTTQTSLLLVDLYMIAGQQSSKHRTMTPHHWSPLRWRGPCALVVPAESSRRSHAYWTGAAHACARGRASYHPPDSDGFFCEHAVSPGNDDPSPCSSYHAVENVFGYDVI